MAELIPDLIAKMETNLQARLRKRFHAWLLHAPVSAPDMDDQVSTVSETMSIDEATELCTRVFVAGSAEDKFSFKPVHGPPPTGYTDVLSRSERDDDPNGSVSYFSGSVYQTVDHNIFFDWLWEETIDLG